MIKYLGGLAGRQKMAQRYKYQFIMELSSEDCVKVEVDVLGFPSLLVSTVSVDVKQHWNWNWNEIRRQETVLPGKNPSRVCLEIKLKIIDTQPGRAIVLIYRQLTKCKLRPSHLKS